MFVCENRAKLIWLADCPEIKTQSGDYYHLVIFFQLISYYIRLLKSNNLLIPVLFFKDSPEEQMIEIPEKPFICLPRSS